MSSIVLDLQNEVTKADCDIVNVLRKAHLIAVKLGLSEFDQWISNELNGYSPTGNIPDYRRVRGEVKAWNPLRGWIPTMFPNDKIHEKMSSIYVPNSVSEILSLCSGTDNGLTCEFSSERLQYLNNMFPSPVPLKYTLHLSRPAVGDIIEKVKNAVLEWTIRLEAEGILGEGMQFNSEEKEKAAMVPQTINNIFYAPANVVNAPVDHSAVVAGNENRITFTYEAANHATDDIEAAIKADTTISAEDQETALELVAEIRDKIASEKKPNLIKAALSGLRDFLIGTGAGIAAEYVLSVIHQLF